MKQFHFLLVWQFQVLPHPEDTLWRTACQYYLHLISFRNLKTILKALKNYENRIFLCCIVLTGSLCLLSCLSTISLAWHRRCKVHWRLCESSQHVSIQSESTSQQHVSHGKAVFLICLKINRDCAADLAHFILHLFCALLSVFVNGLPIIYVSTS